jgi:hypothetical protein
MWLADHRRLGRDGDFSAEVTREDGEAERCDEGKFHGLILASILNRAIRALLTLVAGVSLDPRVELLLKGRR